MASKRYTPLDDPPSASSSDDDETEDDEQQQVITHKPIHHQSQSSSSSSDDEDDSEEEEEEETEDEAAEPINIKKPQIQNPNSKPPQLQSSNSSSSSSEEEETPTFVKKQKPKTLTLNPCSVFEFDSDVRSPTASGFVIKPSKKVTPEKTPISKRPSSGSLDTKEKKKKIKVSNGDVAEDEKKSVTKRVWSVDDELMLLQGFIDYHFKTGRSPLSDMDGFYQFTMSSIPGYASKSQLYEKVRRLKKKFRVNSEKIGTNNNGQDFVFSKPHEGKLFELSNKIWGVGGCETVTANTGGGSSGKAKVRVSKAKPKSEVKIEKEEEEEGDEKVVKLEDFETLYPYWNAGLTLEVSSALKFPAGVVDLVKENLSVIGEAKAKEMNDKWEAVFENEAVLRKRRIALLSKIGDVETA